MSAYEYAVLALAASTVDELEAAKGAAANRLRHMTRDVADSDGHVRGLGLSPLTPMVRTQQAIVEGLADMEKQAVRALERAVRQHPLGPWIKATVGVGEKQGGRLLAAIGDPYWNTLHDRPRTVGELHAYCGLHVVPVSGHSRLAAHRPPAADGVSNSLSDQRPGDWQATGVGEVQAGDGHARSGSQLTAAAAADPAGGDPDQAGLDRQSFSVGVAPRRQRGQKVNWSATARKRAWLVADSCVKQKARSPYGPVYDDGRLKYAAALHQTPCARCGPKGKPAPAGSPLSLGHQDARARRLVMKEVLEDLWRESRRLHGHPDELSRTA